MIATRRAISLFSGAGGMDIGFARAGFRSVLACELDRDACHTYNANLAEVGHLGNGIHPTSITDLDLDALPRGVDVVFGGPPCQGFSVAGKMNPDDERSRLIHSFFDIVDAAAPLGFVCENVKNLAVSSRWQGVREQLMRRARRGYRVALLTLDATDFGVPQIRERMFLVGVRKDVYGGSDATLARDLAKEMDGHRRRPTTVGDIIRALGPVGTGTNPRTCTAKVSYARSPVLRRSPYAGMLFNGAGRPLPIDGWATTLPASMGGNKTPIIDEDEVFGGQPGFVQQYHRELMDGGAPRLGDAPARLRRLTILECMAIQTFPADYDFRGAKSAVYRQIGNAVPCDLAEAVARSFSAVLARAERLTAAAA